MEQDQPVVFVKLTAEEDKQPLWINIGQVMGIRERPEGGVALLTQGGALQVTESLEVIFSLPPIQCWQVPEPAAVSDGAAVEDPPPTE